MTVTSDAGARLAADGGAPVRTAPFPPWPSFGPEEVAAAVATLRSGRVNYWTGTAGRRFEAEFAGSTAVRHAVALANGTVALEIALRALGIGPGDEVLLPSRTFIATASSVVAVGARPVVVDVDEDSQNLTAQTMVPAITDRTRAVIAVHLAGWPVDMDAVCGLARSAGLAVVEDCAQAHGARHHGRPVGSLGDAGAWSFCQDKILTTGGEGGMLTTDRDDVREFAWSYKDHGKSWDAVHRTQHEPGFRWLHESFGTNARMHEIGAAIGREALRKLPGWVSRRRANAAILTARLGALPGLRVPTPPGAVEHSYYKWYGFLDTRRLRPGWTRDRVADAIQKEGIPCGSGSCSEIYLERAFPPDLRPRRRLPVARRLGETSLMLLVHPTLGAAEMNDAADAAEKVLAHCML